MQIVKSHQTASNRLNIDKPPTGAGLTVVVLVLGITLMSLGKIILDQHDVASGAALSGLIGLGVTAVGGLVLLWWGFSFCCAVSAELLRRRGSVGAARRIGSLSPAFMRRTACLALGMNLVVLPAAHAAASEPRPSYTSEQVSTVQESTILSPQWMPVESQQLLEPSWEPAAPLPGGGLLVKEPREIHSFPGSTTEAVVQPGDSLWTIAARHLGSEATDANVAKAWPRWYEANRSVIGESPELLQPGWVLHAPLAVPSESN